MPLAHDTTHRTCTHPAPGGTRAGARRTMLLAAVLMGSTLATSGCGGESSAAPATGLDPAAVSRVAHATKHTTPSTTPPATRGTYTLPDAAKAHTQAGALAFVRFYWDTLAALDAKPEIGVIPKFSAPTCRSCARQEENVELLAGEQARAITTGESVGPLKVRQDSNDNSIVVTFTYSNTGSRHVKGDETLRSFPAINDVYEMRADWTPGGWRLGESGRVAQK